MGSAAADTVIGPGLEFKILLVLSYIPPTLSALLIVGVVVAFIGIGMSMRSE